ncbi:hypothetical protein UPYG_G00154730 [Umbra pygmaea]|uniref:Immunoglobulin domain-containing protein n=1 Tax=Umbra pygmaea TaxID=75934 RepID=A0ABD0X2B8_UMBPY
MLWFRLCFLSFLTAPSVLSFLNGICPQKDPPPGVLVVPSGSTLVLGCSGEVEVNGRKVTVKASEPARTSRSVQTTTDKATLRPITDVNLKSTFGKRKDTTVFAVTATPFITRKKIAGTNLMEGLVTSNPPIRRHTSLPGRGVQNGNGESVKKRTEEESKGEPNESGLGLHTVNQQKRSDSQSRAPPTGMMLQPTADSGVGGADTEQPSDWLYEDADDEYEVVGGRPVRGLRGRFQWRLNGRLLRGGQDGGGVLVRSGATLTLTSMVLSDSGNYSCHRGGQRHFSLRVSVADPPEKPMLSCYKRSPSSKIRCDWTASKPVTPVPQCSLLLSKRLEPFSRVNCSYSVRLLRCWCVLDHKVEEWRESHQAYLCVTNTAGNTTSPPSHLMTF